MAFIEINGLTKRYQGDADCVEALRGVDITVEEGSFLGVMGPSGSGKSTLLAILGGLCHPTAGSVEVDGIDLYALSGEKRADFRREYLGFVFQSFNLIPYLSALENVMLPLAVKTMPAAEKRERAQQVLARVGLSARAAHLPSQLSGGEQERVAIARALVNKPTVLFGDEPTGNLDSASSAEVMELMREINQRTGTTFVLVTHDEDVAGRCDRVVRMRDGVVIDHGMREFEGATERAA